MKILNLKAENVKKLIAVDITPKENTIVISGKNGAGKTSVLDSILFALGGERALKNTPKPIRDGQDHARVELDLGKYKVVRTWTKEGHSYVSLSNKEGAIFSSPQKMLDEIVGQISFDPLEFSRMKPEEQKDILLDVLGLKEKVYDIQNNFQVKYEERRMVGRDLKTAQGHLASVSLPLNYPSKPVDTVKLTEDLKVAEENNQSITSAKNDNQYNEERIKELKEEIDKLTDNIHLNKELLKGKRMMDVDGIREKLGRASEDNQLYSQAQIWKKAKETVKIWEKKYADYEVVLRKFKSEKDDLIIKAKLPIKGLNISDSGVTFKGIPFSQLSAAEQLKVSLAIAMASNPKLRVIRILDGSLLDSVNMKVIREMADSQDYQVWIERVEDDGKVSIIIEEGEVK